MTAQTLTLASFLLARIAEDEEAARAVEPLQDVPVIGGPQRQSFGHVRRSYATEDGYPRTLGDPAAEAHFARHDPARVLAECEAKRRIVELHKSWPVLVETQPEFAAADPADPSSVVYRMSQQIAWTTEQHYRERFGEEPPTAPTLRALAQPYADHPDFRSEWRA
jgi:hypothetical protein